MTSSRPARRTIRRTRIRRGRVAVLVAALAICGVAGDQMLASAPSTATTPDRAADAGVGGAAPPAVPPAPRIAGAEGLDPELADALQRAAADAAAAGIVLRVDSGRRSPERQQQLLDEAVRKHGSPAEASRWVATPERSAHVSGDAIDVGPDDARAWLSATGARYGLCRTYGNEPWHFELRPQAVSGGCPPMYPDPTYDPRMR